MKHFFFIFFIILIGKYSFAQSDTLKVVNAENKTIIFTNPDLQRLPQKILKIDGEDGVPHSYSGVDIQLLLNKAGVSFGKDVRKQTLDSYMYIKAADGYSVIYALAEIDTAFSNNQIILALMKDGNILPQNYKPYQIIATGEKKHARMVRMVTEIDVRKAE